MRNRPKLRGAAAVGIGVVFNLLLFAALAALNRSQPVEPRVHAPVRLALFQLPTEEPLRRQPERERELPGHEDAPVQGTGRGNESTRGHQPWPPPPQHPRRVGERRLRRRQGLGGHQHHHRRRR